MKEINHFKYDNSENLGNAFEYLLSILGVQKKAGQFRTPRHIIDFIVEVVDPQKHETVLDPACGTAGFLISTYKHIIRANSSNYKPQQYTPTFADPTTSDMIAVEVQRNGQYSGDKLTPDARKKLTNSIVGYDIEPGMVRLALVNLYLHGFVQPKINEYDTLTSDTRWGDDFNVILANPPFMTPKGGIIPHKRFSVQANRTEVLFVDYIAEHLSIRGRAGIIVPDGIVSNSPNAYKLLRKNLVETWGLYAVVSLPSGVFKPYSEVKTSILFIDREFAKQTDSILFVQVENDGFDLGDQRKRADKNDLPLAFDTLKHWRKTQGLKKEHQKLAHSVSKSTIAENGEYNLTSNRYQEVTDYRNVKWPLVKLGEVLSKSGKTKVKNEKPPIMSITMEKGLIDQNTRFKRRVASKDISNYKMVYQNELVVGFPINEKVLGFQRKYSVAAVSPAYNIWKLKASENIDVGFVEIVLRSEKLSRVFSEKMRGTTGRRRTISETDFLHTLIPLPPLAIQQQIVAEIERHQSVINGAKQVVASWEPSFRIDPDWPLVELGESVATITPPKKIQKSNYQKLGKYPVIDQSQDEIAGWTNDIEFLVNEEKPLVIFGDHTCNVKYLEKPFAQGADGIKIIKTNSNVLPRFLYFVLKANFINPDGYKRHFTKLKSLPIPLPPLATQERIVAEIEAEQKAVNECKALIEKTERKIEAKINEVWGG